MKFTQEMAEAQNARFDESGRRRRLHPHVAAAIPPDRRVTQPLPKKRIRQSQKPLMNVLESDYRDHLKAEGHTTVLEQAITLRLDPPFKSYRPDLAYWKRDFDPHSGRTTQSLVFVECKGPHRFREKGIAKAALAAKTYPMFQFILAERDGYSWVITNL